jgi:thioester reductase-like protein
VARLLDDPEMRVLALVRAASPHAAIERLDQTLAALGAKERAATDTGRIRALAGDAEQPRFGLGAPEYDELATRCTHLIHCAGAVRMNLPLGAARRSAIDSVGNVLRLAQRLADRGTLAKVEVVSTVGVAGRDNRLLREDWVGADHRFHNTYEQAKAEAEQAAHEAVLAGVPVSVHRPSMVVGHSQTGQVLRFQVFYYLVEFLSGRRTGGILPEFGAARLDIVPVDFVAEAIVRSSASRATIGRILHVCAGPNQSLSLRRLQAIVHDRLAARGEVVPKPRYLSPRLFRAATGALRLFADAKARAALDTLPVFLDYLDTDQAFDNSLTVEWLKQEGITPPRAEDYLSRVLDFYFSAKSRARTERMPTKSNVGPR